MIVDRPRKADRESKGPVASVEVALGLAPEGAYLSECRVSVMRKTQLVFPILFSAGSVEERTSLMTTEGD